VPITFHCTPCLANFSYIVDVDNMAEQMELIKRTDIVKVGRTLYFFTSNFLNSVQAFAFIFLI
jgi:hypothetical protein